MKSRLESEAELAVEVIKLREEVDQLKAEVKTRDALIDTLNACVDRKISHGCIGTYCKDCDR